MKWLSSEHHNEIETLNWLRYRTKAQQQILVSKNVLWIIWISNTNSMIFLKMYFMVINSLLHQKLTKSNTQAHNLVIWEAHNLVISSSTPFSQNL
jgi:hypothetical protein